MTLRVALLRGISELTQKMSFEKEGFFFTIKFLMVVGAVFAVTKFYSDTAFSYAVPTEYNTEILDHASASIRTARNSLLALSAISVAGEQLLSSQDRKLIFVGDIMLDRGVGTVVDILGARDFRYPFLHIRELLASYAFTFANLEGPISDRGQNQGGLYSFRMDPRAAVGLAFAGIDMVSLANNHMADWGREALVDTLSYLAQKNISYTGAGLTENEAYAPKFFRMGETVIAFLAYTQSGGVYYKNSDLEVPGIALIDEKRVIEGVAQARHLADIVVVSFHFGEEYRQEPNEYQQKISHKAVDVGADLVVGHHPHVVQPVEQYGTGFIAYSLGNFVFDQNFSPETMEGAMLEVTIRDKQILNVSLRKVQLNQTFQPKLSQDPAIEAHHLPSL